MINFKHIITNGYIDIETIEKYQEEGWDFVTTIPAYTIHPHSLKTDKLTIFAKYTEEKQKVELEVEVSDTVKKQLDIICNELKLRDEIIEDLSKRSVEEMMTRIKNQYKASGLYYM